MASELPEGITQKELDELAKLDKAIKKASERSAILRDKLKTAVTKKGTYVFGKVVVKRGTTNRFDAESFEKDYSPVMFPEMFKTSVDATKVSKELKAHYVTPVETVSITISE
jgi:hypothetical protein